MPNTPERQTRKNDQQLLFDTKPNWSKHWWGMPEFEMNDAMPGHRVTMNFMTKGDFYEFAKLIGAEVSPNTNSMWFPKQKRMNGEYEYTGKKTDSIYPICIPSKGRADCQLTGHALDRMGVSYRFFVEDHEYDTYVRHLGRDRVVRMPFSNLGQGSIPARNFIWDWAVENGFRRHWTVDDNIARFSRLNMNRRIAVCGGGFFRAMEDFVDRYENVVMAGPHHEGFVPDRSERITPILFNSRVYSCILLDSSLPDRWRGRYNEDTDLSLRLLKQGMCTLLFRALLMSKAPTVGVKNGKALKGGNTDNVYNTGDNRLAFAQSLADQHPDVVSVVWKFNRWHHLVDYSPFERNEPKMKDSVTVLPTINNYGMELVRRGEASSENRCDASDQNCGEEL